MKKAATNSGRNLRSMYMSSFLIPSMPYSEYYANLHQYRQWAKQEREFFLYARICAYLCKNVSCVERKIYDYLTLVMTTKRTFERNPREVSTNLDRFKILRRLVKIILRVVLLKKWQKNRRYFRMKYLLLLITTKLINYFCKSKPCLHLFTLLWHCIYAHIMQDSDSESYDLAWCKRINLWPIHSFWNSPQIYVRFLDAVRQMCRCDACVFLPVSRR